MIPADQRRPRSGLIRTAKERGFVAVAWGATALAIGILAALIFAIAWLGLPHLSWDFLTRFPSKDAESSGFKAALYGSILVMFICGVVGIPLGVASAVLLEEYQPKHAWLRRLHGLIQMNITNLAGVPSIVYGILGLTAFAQMFGLFGNPLEPKFVIGQQWYHRYMDAAGKSYYLPVSGRGAASTPAHADLPLRAEPSRRAPEAEFSVVRGDQITPLKESVEREIDTFHDALSDGINATRGPRGIGAAAISPAAAETIVDQALAAASFRSDMQKNRDQMIAWVRGMNGLDGAELRAIRREVFGLVDRAERDRLLQGVIVAGSEPTLIDQRAWYYFALPFGRGVLAGALTLMLVILPIIIVSSQEALRAVPQSMRHGAMALGATKWQAIAKIALPAAIPGTCTGAILALSRAIGEAAPLLIIAGIVFITFTPGNLMDDFTVMPLQIYNWAGKPGGEFHRIAATGIIVLLAVLLSFNALAVFVRNRFQKPLS